MLYNHPSAFRAALLGSLLSMINSGFDAEEARPQPAAELPAAAGPGSSAKGLPAKEELQALISTRSAASTGNLPPVTPEELKHKLSFASMMLHTKSGRRIIESDNADAKIILEDVKLKLEQANQQAEQGNTEQANKTLGEALRLFNAASRMVPSENLKEKQHREYPDLLEEINVAKDLHQRNYDKVTAEHGMAAGVAYDQKKVEALIGEAEQYARGEEYAEANLRLEVARNTIQQAIREMMTGRKIVYELNIDTPEGEYQYELNKYIGYEELIPVAIERKKPNKGLLGLVNRHHEKAKWMADEAHKQAEAQEYAKAIRMLQDATAEIRKALKIMGVPSIG